MDNKLRENSLKNLKRMTSERAKELGFGKWMKGKKLSEETKKKISLSNIGGNKTSFKKGSTIGIATRFKKGHKPWSFGQTKKTNKSIAAVSGENHYNWKGGITEETNILRDKFKKNYAQKVFKRDNYTCQICGATNTYFHVDHIKSWAEYPELRFELSNCRTLCKKCHYKITYGKEIPDPNLRFGQYK